MTRLRCTCRTVNQGISRTIDAGRCGRIEKGGKLTAQRQFLKLWGKAGSSRSQSFDLDTLRGSSRAEEYRGQIRSLLQPNVRAESLEANRSFPLRDEADRELARAAPLPRCSIPSQSCSQLPIDRR